MNNNIFESFKQEEYLMSRLRHPNIVLIMKICWIAQREVQSYIHFKNERNFLKNLKMKKIFNKQTLAIVT